MERVKRIVYFEGDLVGDFSTDPQVGRSLSVKRAAFAGALAVLKRRADLLAETLLDELALSMEVVDEDGKKTHVRVGVDLTRSMAWLNPREGCVDD